MVVWVCCSRVQIQRYFIELTCYASYALYSSFSPGFQKYLEGLSVVHSATAQADGNRAAGLPVRRKEVETIHPLVRVNPATGWKSVYVNHGLSIAN